MKALIDADTPIYSVAIVSEDDSLNYAIARLDKMIYSIIESSGATEATLFVSGDNNFRNTIYPEYKANRDSKIVPKYRKQLKQHLIKEWNAVVCDGYEADDGCGMNQTNDTIICGIDKDLWQIPGHHYSWPIIRKGEIVRKALHQEITEEQGMRNFFMQVLTGDTSDNIKGVYGIGKKKAFKILENVHTEKDMYDEVNYFYTSSLEHTEEVRVENEKRLLINLDLLWIWRELGVTYTKRKSNET